MGYRRERVGIERRAAACAGSWRAHLQASRRLVTWAARCSAGGDTALVIGSGPLSDVPVEALSRSFRRVILADIIQPRELRRAVARFGNVEPVQLDVTGIARPVFDHVRRRRPGSPPVGAVDHFLDRRIDLVVSANLLSQLALVPCAYLEAGPPTVPPGVLESFARAIVEAHLEWLGRFDARVVLITDVWREERGSDGAPRRVDLLNGVRLPPWDLAWHWDIAPRGTVFDTIEVRHKVAGYADYPPPAP